MPKTHDYTRPTWGHDYATMNVIDGGQQLRLSGWGSDIHDGDYLIIRNGNGTTRYRVDRIEYRMDPADMWFADVTFAPRPAITKD